MPRNSKIAAYRATISLPHLELYLAGVLHYIHPQCWLPVLIGLLHTYAATMHCTTLELRRWCVAGPHVFRRASDARELSILIDLVRLRAKI